MKPYMMILGLIEAAVGLVRFLTLGNYAPPWDFDYLFWNSKREMKKRKAAQ